MAPALVLLSGGMDSSTLIHYVAKELRRAPLHALSFHYGQRHARELESAAWQARAAGAASYHVADMGFVGTLIREGTTLVAGGADVPAMEAVSEAERDQPPTYVPNRNMMLLSIAAAAAEARGVQDVFYGAQVQDEYGYWDCTSDFLARMNAAFALNRREPVTIHAPFISLRKADILRKGHHLGVDYAHTWTCYRGGERPCGVCPACVERAQAWREFGQPDPLV